MIQITVQATEHFDSALKRFNMKVQQSGLLKILKEHAHYEKPRAKRRRKQKKSLIRI